MRETVANWANTFYPAMPMDKLRDPWIFATASAGLTAVATYVWAQVTDKHQPAQAATRAFLLSLFSLLLLTWLSSQHGASLLTEPFPA